ncbi:class I SAM-dependent methyltransferase [Sphingobacterium sp. lm-10]|uniref:class I SAM-dependent methyltransferase n=1 Tax=Sphingobacterium sp. lm-10 TaxID=2944904 RepID=UPI0020218F24|nr:methyltransferase domain-containing protein [Sphingobacterium sp. lm-10]MCL7986570.1 class I SAM-dependent methyltransferase [Sphingobacterium sp. lm-10]
MKPLLALLLHVVLLLAVINVFISLLVSYYVYDSSDLYELPFLPALNNKKILQVHAGFDEISDILAHKFPKALHVNADFYDPEKHTEISVKRARKAYPTTSPTLPVKTNILPFDQQEFDSIILFFSAHEIRDHAERVHFFRELHRVIKPSGHIYMTEHVRDASNFAAYSFGAFHFYTRKTWNACFQQADVALIKEVKTTPFITTFVLSPHGKSH